MLSTHCNTLLYHSGVVTLVNMPALIALSLSLPLLYHIVEFVTLWRVVLHRHPPAPGPLQLSSFLALSLTSNSPGRITPTEKFLRPLAHLPLVALRIGVSFTTSSSFFFFPCYAAAEKEPSTDCTLIPRRCDMFRFLSIRK